MRHIPLTHLSLLPALAATFTLALASLTTAADPAAPSDWARREYCGLSAETPGEMKATDLPLPEQVKAILSKSETFALLAPGWELGITHLTYIKADANLVGAANGAVASMKNASGVAEFTSEITDATLDGVTAKKVAIKCTLQGTPIASVAIMAAKGHDLFSITVVGPAANAEVMAKRVIESAKWLKTAPAAALPAAGPVTWQRQDCDGLSLDLPGVMVTAPMELPDAAKGQISSMQSHMVKLPAGHVAISHAVYSQADADVNGSVNGATESVKSLPGVTDFTSQVFTVTADGVPAKTLVIKCKRKGADVETYMLCVAKGREIWSVLILGEAPAIKDTAKRVIESAKWKK